MTASPLPETVPIASLAGLFGVTDRQARNLLEMSKVKSHGRGQWPLSEAVRAVLAQARESREPDQLSAARARAIRAKARQTEIALARQERELIPVDEVLSAFDTVLGGVVSALNGLPARVTRDMEIRRKIEAEIHAARVGMAKDMQAAAAKLRQDADDYDQEDAA